MSWCPKTGPQQRSKLCQPPPAATSRHQPSLSRCRSPGRCRRQWCASLPRSPGEIWGPHERQRWDVPTRLGNDSHKIWDKHGKTIRKKVFFAGKIIALFLGDFPAVELKKTEGNLPCLNTPWMLHGNDASQVGDFCDKRLVRTSLGVS